MRGIALLMGFELGLRAQGKDVVGSKDYLNMVGPGESSSAGISDGA